MLHLPHCVQCITILITLGSVTEINRRRGGGATEIKNLISITPGANENRGGGGGALKTLHRDQVRYNQLDLDQWVLIYCAEMFAQVWHRDRNQTRCLLLCQSHSRTCPSPSPVQSEKTTTMYIKYSLLNYVSFAVHQEIVVCLQDLVCRISCKYKNKNSEWLKFENITSNQPN